MKMYNEGKFSALKIFIAVTISSFISGLLGGILLEIINPIFTALIKSPRHVVDVLYMYNWLNTFHTIWIYSLVDFIPYSLALISLSLIMQSMGLRKLISFPIVIVAFACANFIYIFYSEAKGVKLLSEYGMSILIGVMPSRIITGVVTWICYVFFERLFRN